ncbi:MAG: UTP--glucose-1-phosphate uridylyltransferase [Acidobacteria bacterium]|jgi:UTP--glucose-1-phosphate uridylyltransferase|nr:UTP--glucose-1-phosphate uridylyltransferase [Acidobacteriota bacterium]MDP7691869.1 UTP--glucose-1-phosphate uridylyltransferase [Vicinamibacterales bacterium]HJN44378.1 UTP--glucose-1-phosphate uridylyltransferase [Vicinamibacterales bacterium]|tara:strand:+ start:510 stop:1400 length:891 start_codon:yes stop_codon:yes gene_type:complete
MSTPPTVRKVVFPAAGLGTRILPATAVLPKELLPIIDKPVIQFGVEEALASGLSQIILVSSPGKTLLEDHFDRHPELEEILERRGKSALLDGLRDVATQMELSTVFQDEPLGLGHAVLVSRELVDDEPFAVALSDDVIDADPPALRQMLTVYDEVGGPVLLVERVPRDAVSRYGVIDGESLGGGVFKVRDLVEKPDPAEAPSDLTIIGRYILTPDIYPALEATGYDAGGEMQLTDGLRRLLETRPIHAVELDGIRQDAGNKLGYLRAILYFARKHPELAGHLPELLRTLESDDALT